MSRNKKSTKRGSSYNKLRAEFFWEMALSVLNVRTCIHTYMLVLCVLVMTKLRKMWTGGGGEYQHEERGVCSCTRIHTHTHRHHIF